MMISLAVWIWPGISFFCMSINGEKQKNFFTDFYFSVLIISYTYCKIDM